MSKEMFFFATRKDIGSVILSIESKYKFTYTKTGTYESISTIQSLNSLLAYENLGINISGNHQSESFLVLDTLNKLNIRERTISSGEKRYYIDQENNKNSIVIWPGGLCRDMYLICGHIATISEDEESLALYKKFTQEIKKHFKKDKRYYLGQDAIKLSQKVRLITMGINQPEIFDFKVICES